MQGLLCANTDKLLRYRAQKREDIIDSPQSPAKTKTMFELTASGGYGVRMIFSDPGGPTMPTA